MPVSDDPNNSATKPSETSVDDGLENTNVTRRDRQSISNFTVGDSDSSDSDSSDEEGNLDKRSSLEANSSNTDQQHDHSRFGDRNPKLVLPEIPRGPPSVAFSQSIDYRPKLSSGSPMHTPGSFGSHSRAASYFNLDEIPIYHGSYARSSSGFFSPASSIHSPSQRPSYSRQSSYHESNSRNHSRSRNTSHSRHRSRPRGQSHSRSQSHSRARSRSRNSSHERSSHQQQSSLHIATPMISEVSHIIPNINTKATTTNADKDIDQVSTARLQSRSHSSSASCSSSRENSLDRGRPRLRRSNTSLNVGDSATGTSTSVIHRSHHSRVSMGSESSQSHNDLRSLSTDRPRKPNPQSYLERTLFGSGQINNTAGNKDTKNAGIFDGDDDDDDENDLINEIEGTIPAVRCGFGLEELREGFFDAIYAPISVIEKLAYESVSQECEIAAKTESPFFFSLKIFNSIKGVVHLLMGAENSLKLFKAFTAFFIAYVLCLVSVTGEWLGEYRYFLALATILHQAGHSSGSQIEILAQATVGTAMGIGIGALSVYVSTSTPAARQGYGGLLALFLSLVTFLSSWVRASFIRIYHGMLSFQMSLIMMTVAGVSDQPRWHRARELAVPYILGIALSCVVNLLIVPDFFHTQIISTFSEVFAQCRKSLETIIQADSDTQADDAEVLNKVSNTLSIVIREMLNEITISQFSNEQAISLRNVLQIFIGRIRVVPCPIYLYGPLLSDYEYATLTGSEDARYHQLVAAESIRLSHVFIRDTFQESSTSIIRVMIDALTNMQQFAEYMKTPIASFLSRKEDTEHKFVHIENLQISIQSIRACQHVLEHLSEHLLERAEACGIRVEWRATPVVNVLVYVHYLYDMSRSLSHVLDELLTLGLQKRKWIVSPPNYPFARALKTNTRQITHDRGGQSAFYFYLTKNDVERVFKKIHEMNTAKINADTELQQDSRSIQNQSYLFKVEEKRKLRYKIWKFFHRLQGYESKFAIRTALTVTLLSVPGWISSSRDWYNYYDLWMAPIVALLVLHPRVGGNIHDLFVRTALALLGTVWGGITYRVRYGNPYVMAVMCAVFMVPAFYRFVISSHPRSGLLACISFTFTSMSMYVNGLDGEIKIVSIAWAQGCAVIVGVASSIIISWIFWPFVARQEVRKAMGIVLSHLSQCYQSVTDRYLYKDEGNDPTALTLSLSEIREARMRLSMDAYSELINMTHHEPSLEETGHPGSFDPIPYQWLLNSSRIVLQKVSEARISSIYFSVHRYDDQDIETQMTLMSLRRDAVASVIFLLYMLSSAFASNNKILSHMPSPAMSRKMLFDGMAEIEKRHQQDMEAELMSQRDMSKTEFEQDGDVESEPHREESSSRAVSGNQVLGNRVKFIDHSPNMPVSKDKEKKTGKKENDKKSLMNLRQKVATAQMQEELAKRKRVDFVDIGDTKNGKSASKSQKSIKFQDGLDAQESSKSMSLESLNAPAATPVSLQASDTLQGNDNSEPLTGDPHSNLATNDEGNDGEADHVAAITPTISLSEPLVAHSLPLPAAAPSLMIPKTNRKAFKVPLQLKDRDREDFDDNHSANILAPTTSHASDVIENSLTKTGGHQEAPVFPGRSILTNAAEPYVALDANGLPIANIHNQTTVNTYLNAHSHGHHRVFSPTVADPNPLPPHSSVLEKSQYIWALVHETTFSQTFTEIAQELEKMVAYSKYVLGEEEIWSDKVGGGGAFDTVF